MLIFMTAELQIRQDGGWSLRVRHSPATPKKEAPAISRQNRRRF
jgi:hypothetical protein